MSHTPGILGLPRGFLTDYPSNFVVALCETSIKKLESEDPLGNPNRDEELTRLRNMLDAAYKKCDDVDSAVGRSATSDSDWEFVSRGSSSVAAATNIAEPVRVSSRDNLKDHHDEDHAAIYAHKLQHPSFTKLEQLMHIENKTARVFVNNPVVTLAFTQYRTHFLACNPKSKPPPTKAVVDAWGRVNHALARWCVLHARKGAMSRQVALACFFVTTVKEYLYTPQGQAYYPRTAGMSEVDMVVGLVDGLLAWLHKSAQLGGLNPAELENFLARTHRDDSVEAVWRELHQ
ncbi:hypothetical protein Micbo1qcDRAFT_206338 [Microdochium bolleyi]|uniref:Uncharacterized protein n=1 Tax=Microdochium bolleyi TaxID=196109 RepID=A0A136IXC6_9PEZI|nr:hypothetical protein Micbo1qcDRAFT_206338 [Microdochium bolleyi]